MSTANKILRMIESVDPNDTAKPCDACFGQGHWECECCNGSRGCSCGGQPVYMGQCNVCEGSGMVDEQSDLMANVKSISGLAYLGSGPRSYP